jgi:hypothetical protein
MTHLAVLVFSVCVLFVGCTGPVVYSYSKSGSDAADFRRDSYACVQEPQMSWVPVKIPSRSARETRSDKPVCTTCA